MEAAVKAKEKEKSGGPTRRARGWDEDSYDSEGEEGIKKKRGRRYQTLSHSAGAKKKGKRVGWEAGNAEEGNGRR
jgi:hypothetical protein